MKALLLVIIFAAATLLGHKVLKGVPSLLHTPLMSGMNALSGVTILGAITAMTLALSSGSMLLAALAVILAMINLVGGFAVTRRMLMMFNTKDRQQ